MPTPKIALVLDAEQAATLASIFDSAARGRDDFEYLAGQDQGDYSAEDVATARLWHEREVELEAELREMLDSPSQIPPLMLSLIALSMQNALTALEERRSTGKGSRSTQERLDLADARVNGMADMIAMMFDVSRTQVWDMVEEAAMGTTLTEHSAIVGERIYQLGGSCLQRFA